MENEITKVGVRLRVSIIACAELLSFANPPPLFITQGPYCYFDPAEIQAELDRADRHARHNRF